MKSRILIFSWVLAGLSILIASALIHMVLYWDFEEKMKKETMAASNYIASAIEPSGISYLKSMDPRAMGHHIILIDRDGTILFDNAKNAPETPSYENRPEIQSALLSGVGESVYTSGLFGKKTYSYAVRLSDSRILWLESTADRAYTAFVNLVPLIVAIALILFILAIPAASRATRRIADPINAINLDTPEENDVCVELSPLISRMRRQRETISAQMAALRQTQMEFSAITDHMREGFLVLDKDARVLSYNKSVLALLQAHLENPIHQSVLTLYRAEPFRVAVERALGGESSELVLVIGKRHCQLMANPVTDGGVVQGAVIVLLDVTEREARETLRREFTANVSHELKTPLTAISGYAEIIANGVAKSEDIPKFAKSIYAEAQRLITLIGDIMLLSKLDENDASLPKEAVDLYALAEEVISRVRDAAEKRGVEVSLEGEKAEVYGVRAILDEILFNLCDNAIKYNVDGGKMRVTVRRLQHEAVIAVSDTGVGIPASEQARVFERFYRVDKSHSRSVAGTGLGLSIVKHGAMIHHGRIELQSDGVSGTTVSVHFPV